RPAAVPPPRVGVVGGAGDGLRQPMCVGGEPERSPVAGGPDPRWVDLNDCRLGPREAARWEKPPLTVEAPPGTSRTRATTACGTDHPAHADAAGHARQHFHAHEP